MEASMRPPVLPSGNLFGCRAAHLQGIGASMRPPVLPSGNAGEPRPPLLRRHARFNEAAGFTQRKR